MWKKRVLQAFVAFVFVWPGIHFTLFKLFHIDPWYWAGWAMYLQPAALVDFSVSQLDGRKLPGWLADQWMPRLQEAAGNQVLFGRMYDARPIVQQFLSEFEPGDVDGVRFHVSVRRLNPITGFIDAVPLARIEIPAITPRRAPEAYSAGTTLEDLWGSRWEYLPEDGFGESLWFADGELAIQRSGGREVFDITNVDPGGYCTDYPGCVIATGAQNAVQVWNIYVEGESMFFATCRDYTDLTIDEYLPDDAALRDTFRRVIVWRSRSGLCWVDADALPYRKGE